MKLSEANRRVLIMALAFIVVTVVWFLALAYNARSESVVADVVPGERLGALTVGASVQAYGELGELSFSLQDPLIVDQTFVGMSTNTGGSIAFRGFHVGSPVDAALIAAVAEACDYETPEVVDGDKYERGEAIWFWFMKCGFAIRSVYVYDDDTYGVQAWAVFPRGDVTYKNYIATTFVDRRRHL